MCSFSNVYGEVQGELKAEYVRIQENNIGNVNVKTIISFICTTKYEEFRTKHDKTKIVSNAILKKIRSEICLTTDKSSICIY